MANPDSDRILNAGKTVTFADGSEHALSFGFLALKFIEDEMGGLAGALKAFGVGDGGAPGEVEVVFTPVAQVLAAGLAHEHIKGLRIPRFEDVYAWVLINADPNRIAEYARSGFAALIEAIPNMRDTPEEATAAPDPTPQQSETSEAMWQTNGHSLGAIGTTSAPFVTVVQTASSGG